MSILTVAAVIILLLASYSSYAIGLKEGIRAGIIKGITGTLDRMLQFGKQESPGIYICKIETKVEDNMRDYRIIDNK